MSSAMSERPLSCFAYSTTLCGILIAAALLSALPAHAQTATDIATRQQQLQQQLNDIDAAIASLQTNLQSAQSTQNTLQGELNVLDDGIQEAKLAIQRRNITIQQISQNIQDKQDIIAGLNDRLQSEYDSLAAILRDTNELDNTSMIVPALTSISLSAFFADVEQFSTINANMQASFTDIQNNKQLTEQQKTDLENQLNEETQLRQVQQLQQQQLQAQEAQKNKLLADTKGQEKAYAQVIASEQQTAAQIRAALFELTGTKAIPFERALQYANVAEQETGIRPAFLLGIITEESNLGANVGAGNWRTDMNPTRDQPIFAAITNSLGLDPNSMPVSKKAWYGWGGAMGPAQFIPSTWALYAGYSAPSYAYDPSNDRVGRLTGNHPPNPWNPADAFMAAALYLTDDGAAKQTPASEFKAAMCYLAGCGNAGNVSLQFYGDQVQCLELKYQEDIDTITGSHDANAMKQNRLYYGQC